jgi:hypothetical protein
MWTMLAAIFTLLFPSLPGYACLPMPEVAAITQSHSSSQEAPCHQTVEKKQKCEADEKPCEYSHNTPVEERPSQTCCCSHGDFSFQAAAVVTAPKVALEFGDVTHVSFLTPRVVSTRIHFAAANSPPTELSTSQIPSRAPPKVQQNKLKLF